VAETFEVTPFSDSDEISLQGVTLKHLRCGGKTHPRRSLTDNRFVVRCVCGLEVPLEKDAAGDLVKMAIAEEPQKITVRTVPSNIGLVTFKVCGEV
jgi:hypothetical protein